MAKVYLVGAGCGALELYTLKAMKCIKETDCLIYDALIDQQILDYCKEGCEKIYVGKRTKHHTMSQDDMNQLLVDKAKQYKHVTRLKGGDVYVFGRGGEEAEFLYERGIDFEVVPGISSSIGGLAYAGIPVTHRGLSGGFQVYTGALRRDQERTFNFETMLDDYTTYIFLMSMSRKEYIVEGFLNAGKDPKTACAIVSNASLPSQQVLTGTLDTIIDKFNANPVPMPGIIVVGNVIQKQEILNFYERKPLFGKKILVTTVGVDHYFKDTLTELGASVKEMMTGCVSYLETTLPDIKDNLVFTSKHGAIGFMKAFMKQHHDVRKLAGVRIIAIGKKTNEVLNGYGLSADFIPSSSNSIVLNQELEALTQGEEVYVVCGDVCNVTVPHTSICVYTNEETELEDINEHFDYALFTCASSLERTVEKTHMSANTFVSMGPMTTKAINKYVEDVRVLEVERPVKSKMVDIILGDQ